MTAIVISFSERELRRLLQLASLGRERAADIDVEDYVARFLAAQHKTPTGEQVVACRTSADGEIADLLHVIEVGLTVAQLEGQALRHRNDLEGRHDH